MKKIILSLGLMGLISTGGLMFASAQINYNYYQPALSNCYYTQSYPPTYYGNCSGPGFGYTQNYQNYYPQPTYNSQYSTYGYYRGSWYPGYSSSIIGNFYNNAPYNYNGTGGYYNGNYYNAYNGYNNYNYNYVPYYGGCYTYGC